jgi:hypothetical protein
MTMTSPAIQIVDFRSQTSDTRLLKIARAPQEIPLYPPFSKGEIESLPFAKGRAGGV